jgi:type IV secretory pathway TrbD component
MIWLAFAVGIVIGAIGGALAVIFGMADDPDPEAVAAYRRHASQSDPRDG